VLSIFQYRRVNCIILIIFTIYIHWQARTNILNELNKNELSTQLTCDGSIPFPRPRIIDNVITPQQADRLTKDADKVLHRSLVGHGVDPTKRKSETGYAVLKDSISIPQNAVPAMNDWNRF